MIPILCRPSAGAVPAVELNGRPPVTVREVNMQAIEEVCNKWNIEDGITAKIFVVGNWAGKFEGMGPRAKLLVQWTGRDFLFIAVWWQVARIAKTLMDATGHAYLIMQVGSWLGFDLATTIII